MITEAAQAVAPADSQVNTGALYCLWRCPWCSYRQRATIYWQWILRKEKYNEIIYKEKVEAYKKLHEEFFTAIQDYFKCSFIKVDDAKCTAVFSRISQARVVASVVASGEVNKFCNKTCKAIGDKPYFNDLTDAKTFENAEKITEDYNSLTEEIRKDLKVDPASEAISKTFDPFIGMLKDKVPKKEKPDEK